MDPQFPSADVALPATEGCVRVLRAIAAAIGDELGLSPAAIDDLRIAVDELGMALVLLGDGEPIHVRLGVHDDRLVVHGHTRGDLSGWTQPSFDLSRQVLAVVAPDHDLRAVGGDIEFSLNAPAPMPRTIER